MIQNRFSIPHNEPVTGNDEADRKKKRNTSSLVLSTLGFLDTPPKKTTAQVDPSLCLRACCRGRDLNQIFDCTSQVCPGLRINTTTPLPTRKTSHLSLAHSCTTPASIRTLCSAVFVCHSCQSPDLQALQFRCRSAVHICTTVSCMHRTNNKIRTWASSIDNANAFCRNAPSKWRKTVHKSCQATQMNQSPGAGSFLQRISLFSTS